MVYADPVSITRSNYSWTQEDVLELKGPLPHEFTLSADVTIKPEVTEHTATHPAPERASKNEFPRGLYS